jgi:N-methylhydantoinase B
MNEVVFSHIVREYFETVAEEMNLVMDRTAMSPVFNEAHDCSAGVFFVDEGEVEIIARAQAEPVHIYASLWSTRGILDYWSGDLHAGDVVIVNDPYVYGTHSADWTVMLPLFLAGQPVFFPCVRGHIIEHGCTIPAGVDPEFRDIWMESIRFQPIKLYVRGEAQEDVFAWLRANNRWSEVMIGDLNAMIGSCRAGAKRIVEIVEKYGVERVVEAVRHFLDDSERRVRTVVAGWPDGDYFGRKVADSDYAGNHDLNIDCTVRVRGEELIVDFTGSHEQVTGHVNSTFGSTASWVFTALSCVMPDVRINSGFFRPVKVIAPEGTIVNPISPAPVCTNTILIGSDIGDAVMKALEHLVPERVGSIACDDMMHMYYGHDSRFPDQPFYVHGDYLFAAVMSSASYGVDGWGAWSAAHGSHRMPTVEMTEVQIPTIFLQAEYQIDTAAPGRWRGPPAFRCQKQNPAGQSNVWVVEMQSQRHPLPGWVGGSDGAGSLLVLDYGGPNEQRVEDYVVNWHSGPGEVVMARKGGGGGWGSPLDREPANVLADVLDEYVSIEAARTDYGVVIYHERMEVDTAATERLRSERREGRGEDERETGR